MFPTRREIENNRDFIRNGMKVYDNHDMTAEIGWVGDYFFTERREQTDGHSNSAMMMRLVLPLQKVNNLLHKYKQTSLYRFYCSIGYVSTFEPIGNDNYKRVGFELREVSLTLNAAMRRCTIQDVFSKENKNYKDKDRKGIKFTSGTTPIVKVTMDEGGGAKTAIDGRKDHMECDPPVETEVPEDLQEYINANFGINLKSSDDQTMESMRSVIKELGRSLMHQRKEFVNQRKSSEQQTLQNYITLARGLEGREPPEQEVNEFKDLLYNENFRTVVDKFMKIMSQKVTCNVKNSTSDEFPVVRKEKAQTKYVAKFNGGVKRIPERAPDNFKKFFRNVRPNFLRRS